MADTAAVGYGPITFFIADGGSEISIPISAISFDPGRDGAVHSAIYAGTHGLTDWLNYLVSQGRLVRGTVAAPGNAMVVTATEVGTAGNNITVNVVKVDPPTDPPTVNLTVTETDTYEDLNLGSLAARLGSTPRLVRFKALGTGDPVNGDGAAASPQTVPPSWDLPNGSTPPTPAFTVEARRAGTNPALVTVKVSNVQGLTGAKTFTLEVTWQFVRPNVAVTDLPAFATDVAFAVNVTPPTGGYKLPQEGTVRLGGGANPAQASTTLLASS